MKLRTINNWLRRLGICLVVMSHTDAEEKHLYYSLHIWTCRYFASLPDKIPVYEGEDV